MLVPSKRVIASVALSGVLAAASVLGAARLMAQDGQADGVAGAEAVPVEHVTDLRGKRVLIFGDSISDPNWHAYSYVNWVACMAEDGFVDADKVTDDSVCSTGYAAEWVYHGERRGAPLTERIRRYASDDYDLVVFHIGTNDFGHSERPERFQAAVEDVFDYAQRAFPSAKVAVISPMRRLNMHAANDAGCTLDDYARVIVRKAREHGFATLNMTDDLRYDPVDEGFRKGHTFNGDGLHPTKETTEEILLPMIEPYLLAVVNGDAR